MGDPKPGGSVRDPRGQGGCTDPFPHSPSDAGPGAERVPCRGTVCISDLRIPLMWKDTEYFRNKGELHRCAVFLLLQVGAEIHDTPTVLVDRTLTDICFEGAVLL
ncbi:PREDICTED: rhotekin-like [Lepidothrix coronata]|uniref:Rhotekin-like n=1 Tax=Lepidothrix coronata TaxID=321398 RepID=A0A6J0G7H3_9PASS|nr:PREDICTED: rhotekin-like [Lepidothrix coronata]